MKYIEKVAKTVEDALNLALEELNLTKDKVEVEVLEEPSRGIFGLIGTKQAKIKVTVLDSPEDDAVAFLEDVFKTMNLEAEINTNLKENVLNIEVIGEDMGVLIGRRGQTLDSIQYLVSLVVNKGREEYLRIVLDTENYREKREQTLIRLANKLAYKVKKTRKNVLLEPMNPYERRVIHSALQGHPEVSTRSQGDEPYRRVVITCK